MNYDWIKTAQRIQAIAQAGLHYSEGAYDLERYEELRQISVEMMAHYSDTPMDKVTSLFASEEASYYCTFLSFLFKR